MAPAAAPGPRVRARRRQTRSNTRAQRVAVLVALGSVLLVVLLLTAFGGGTSAVATGAPAPSARLLPAGPPQPQVVALQGTLRLQLPVAQSRVTAIGYHAGSGLTLEPLGRQANAGLFARLFQRVFGENGQTLRWYQLPGGEGASTAVLNVGATPATDVYAPVDGTVVGVSPFVLDGRRYGARITIQPSSSPSLVVSLTHLRPDPALTVGSTVAAGRSKIGTVLDFSLVERQALAQFTQDAGNHVTIEVHPATTLSLR